MKDNLQQYLNRILPVVGYSLRNKTVAVFNPTITCLVADSLARCGVKNQLFFLNSTVRENDPLTLSYGRKYLGKNSAWALKHELINHNAFETEWQISISASRSAANIARVLTKSQVDLLVGGGDIKTCALLHRLSKQTGIPAIIFMVFENLPINSLVCLVHPDLPDYFPTIVKLIPPEKALSAIPLSYRLNWLETLDLTMNFAKALLLRKTEYERADLEDLFFNQQRMVVLRGQANWPWWVYYLNPLEKIGYLEKVFAAAVYTFPPPVQALAEERVMIIGCGTGSLIIGELPNYFRKILLVDYKKFSIYNPVRQLIGTKQIGKKLKPFVLQELLSLRLRPQGPFGIRNYRRLAKSVDMAGYTISASELCLKESNAASQKKFIALLNWFKPTLAIVAMGKTYNDNFVACEILRKKGIKHIVPSAFPGATHFKNIVVDGLNGPCYECLQNNLPVDIDGAAELNTEAREMFYTDPADPTQPATIIETWPSAHAALRLAVELSLPNDLRPAWLLKLLKEEKTCLVGGNISAQDENENSAYLYGVAYPGQTVVYGVNDIVRTEKTFTCPVCGKSYFVPNQIKST